MGYDAFWFIETRDQKRNLKRWILWFILTFAFVSVGSVLAIKTMYEPITNYKTDTGLLAVRVLEAKATNVNGYINGEIRNNSLEDITGKYMRFDFYTKNDVNVGTEYIEIEKLKSEETKTYELKFKYNNVESFIVTIADEKNS